MATGIIHNEYSTKKIKLELTWNLLLFWNIVIEGNMQALGEEIVIYFVKL